MATQYGRTVPKFITFKIDDSGGTLRTVVGIKSINGVGINYDQMDVSAFNETIKSYLNGQGDCQITIVGNVDNTADVGFHNVFSGIAGGATPLAMDIEFGVRQSYTAGEPQFGITGTSANGMVCTSYVVNADDMTGTATLTVFSGSAAPAWGTAAES